MYLTPNSEGETKRFSEFGKVVLVLGAGIGIAKTPDLVNIATSIFGQDAANVTSLRILLFACSTLIFGTFTYMARLHVRGADEHRREKREKLITDMRKALEDLSRSN
jgi:hypothetical protein